MTLWPIITDHLHLVTLACYFCSLVLVLVSSAQVMDPSLNDTVRAGSLSTNWKSFLMWCGERRQTVPLWLEWLCVCVTRAVWERLGTAGRWVQGYKDCFPCEKRSTSDGKLRKCFCQARERRRAVRGQRYTEKREISRSTCDQCRVTNLRSFKALQTGQTLTSPSPDGNALDLPFSPSRHTPPSSSSLPHCFFEHLKVSSLLFIFHRMK